MRKRGKAERLRPGSISQLGRAASPQDPLRIFLSTDLFSLMGGAAGSGWETSQAQAGNVVVETGNWFAAYSVDGGRTFNSLDPSADLRNADGGFCCDQRVIYAPGANSFIWVRQTNPGANGENRYRMGVSTPARILASAGTNWTFYDIVPSQFGSRGNFMDYPDLSASLRYLYMTFNLENGAVMARYSLGALARGERSVRPTYNFPRNQWITPAQNLSDRAYFAHHLSTSRTRVYVWFERPFRIGPVTVSLASYDFDVSSIPQGDEAFDSFLPNQGRNWLRGSKIGPDVVAGTVVGNQVWFAWSAGRGNGFPHPHIEIAKVSARTLGLLGQDYIWNPDHTFVWPDLATNSQDEVGIGFAWGAGRHFVYSGVGFLTGRETFVSSSPPGQASGAHYNEIHPGWPETRLFTVSNSFGAPVSGPYANHPQFIVFGRSSERGPPPPPPPPPPGSSSLTLACPDDATEGRPTTVSGTLTPRLAGVPIRVTWSTGSFSSTRVVTTDRNGNYSDTYSPSRGEWTVRSRFDGNAQAGPSDSPPCSILSIAPPP